MANKFIRMGRQWLKEGLVLIEHGENDPFQFNKAEIKMRTAQTLFLASIAECMERQSGAKEETKLPGLIDILSEEKYD